MKHGIVNEGLLVKEWTDRLKKLLYLCANVNTEKSVIKESC